MKKRKTSEYDLEAIKAFMKLPASKKLEMLQNLNNFVKKISPKSSKKTWAVLKQQDY